jgi:hypothetical protein
MGLPQDEQHDKNDNHAYTDNDAGAALLVVDALDANVLQ